eukprot:gene62709-85761_t
MLLVLMLALTAAPALAAPVNTGHIEAELVAQEAAVPDEIPSVDDAAPILSGKSDLMALKPMNCPAHILIFKQGIKSYRDLPIRMAEFGC